MIDWKPIDSAPKDMTEIVVRLGPKQVCLGWFFAPSSRTQGWCDENGKWIKPTHWDHLPPDPA